MTNTASVAAIQSPRVSAMMSSVLIAASPQMSDKASAAAALAPGGGADDPNRLAVELEFDLRVRQQTRPLADGDRNGHLPFRRNAHSRLFCLSYTKSG